jgi:hypothetical protein
MADGPLTEEPIAKKKRVLAQTRYAVYSLADAVQVASAIHTQGGGVASVDELAVWLGYKSANNGAYYDRLSAARMFGLIQGQGQQITLTEQAKHLLMPVFPEDAATAKVESFMLVPLFRAIYEQFKGSPLPPESGLKNLMRTKYGVPPSRVDTAFRALMESADQAGFFLTRGNRSQLIVPRNRGDERSQSFDARAPLATADGRTLHDIDTRSHDVEPPGIASREELQNAYVSALIEMLRQKGEPDPDMMNKIESLLGMTEHKG